MEILFLLGSMGEVRVQGPGPLQTIYYIIQDRQLSVCVCVYMPFLLMIKKGNYCLMG